MTTNIDRRRLLPSLFPAPKEYLFVAGLAGAARDLAALTNDAPNLFALGGVMGSAAMIGLGMALAAQDRKVAVVTGDGELQMNIGALITIADANPKNLTIVCVDNERHGETGGQLGHTGRKARLEAIASGAGFQSTLAISGMDQISKAAEFIVATDGPRFLSVKVLNTEPSSFKRQMDPAGVRYRFKTAFALKGSS
jgi:phosphonopyruvate decarboxylase